MTEPYDTLLAEIDRITSSPYPTQLKRLRDIACTTCTDSDISRWALSRPCQIQRLVECLLDGLRQWPYVLELATKLAGEVAIRDAVLEQCPSLLHDIINHAAKGASTDSKYVAGAVTCLSHPLPEHTTMPADAQTLFIRLFDQAADEPNLSNIRRVYQILKGTSSLLLGLLSSCSLHRLEEHLFAILRNNKSEHQSLSLYCLSIMKMMCVESTNSFRLSNSQYDTQELLASTQFASTSKWTPDTMQQFFTDSKAQKTVQLVVLRAMWACTASIGETFDERMESLLLANEVIAAVAPHLRESWRKANSLVVGKLQDKVMSPTLEIQLKYQGYLFLAQVTEGSRVPATVIDSLRGMVSDPEKLRQAMCGTTSTQIDHLMDAGVFDENTITAFLQQMVDFVTSSGDEHWLETATCLQSISYQIYAAMASDTKLSEGSMLAMDVISCGQKLRKLLDLIRFADGSACNSTGRVCAAATQRQRCSLVHSLCKVFLRAALSSPHQSYSASQVTITLLLELHAATGSPSVKCSHSTPPNKATARDASFVEETSTPEEETLHWRDALSCHVQSRARADEGRLASVFANACAKLEARCDSIEMPLREEREKRESLERHYQELEQRYSSLEAESADRSIRFNAVEMERDQYIGDLERQHEEIQGHERRIEELLDTLQQAREEAERADQEAQRSVETARMEHAASSAAKDEELDGLQDQVQRTERRVEEKVTELKELQKDMDQLQQSAQEAQQDLESARCTDKERQGTIASLEREKADAIARAEEMSGELQGAREDAVAQREAFERDLNDMRQRAEHDLEEASGEHEEKIADLTRQYDANAEMLRKQLAEAQEDINQAREQHRADIEQWEAEIEEKQKKIDRLTRKCSEKNKQIAEANSMRTNLMAAMGLGGGGAAPSHGGQTLAHRTSRSSATQPATQQYPELDSQEDPSPPTPFSGDEATQQPHAAADTSFASNATSSGESRSGPTPKRPRPRRSIKVASPAKASAARMSTSTRAGGRGSLMVPPTTGGKMRQPLLGVSGNAGRRNVQSRQSFKTPSKGLGITGLGEEEEFGGSEIFEGTLGFAEVGGGFDGEETETGL